MWSSSLVAAAAATLLLALPLTASPTPSSPSSSIDCSSLSDGFFSNGCSSHFTACSGGRSIPMDCPVDLVYDQTRQQCEYPGNVVACGGEAPEEGSGAIEEGSGTEGSGETDGSGVEGSGTEGSGIEGSGTEGSGEIEDISGMCEERPDGFYRLAECGENFLGCSGGVAWRMTCPASLKYDEKNQQCDYPGNVKGCPDAEEGSGEIDGSGTEGSGTEGSGSEGSGSEGSGTDGSGSDVTIEEIEADQIGTQDVIVANKYGSKVTEEMGVKEIEAEDDIIDDNVVVEEKKEEEVVDEEVVDEETEAPTDNTLSPSTHFEDADETPSCEGRRDGFYAVGCSSDMMACSNGVQSMMKCPAGLVFDQRNQMCDHSVHVAGCGARDDLLSEDALLTTDVVDSRPEIPRTRDSESVDATLAPTTEAGPAAVSEAAAQVAAGAAEYAAPSSVVASKGPRKSRRDARCKSSDGLFSLDCSTEFVSCRGGVATKLECGEAEAFDERAQSCVSLARHPECYSHAMQANDVIDEDVQMEKEKDDEADLKKPIDHSFSCDFVGSRAESPCSDWFTLCQEGRGIELYCLQGFLFDGDAAKCVPAGQLPHCKAQ